MATTKTQHSRNGHHLGIDPRDDRDLAWYFDHGHDPDLRGASAEVRKRHRRVDRCLNGGGFALMQRYTGRGSATIGELRSDYSLFVQNKAQPYSALLEPWDVVDEEKLRSFARRLSKGRPTHQIAGDYWLETERTVPLTTEHDRWISDMKRSTWGEIRLGEADARFVLEWGFDFTPDQLRELDAEQMVADVAAAIRAEVVTVRRSRRSLGPREILLGVLGQDEGDPDDGIQAAPRLEAINDAEDGDGEAEAFDIQAFLRSEARWDPDKIERNPHDAMTTVTEIARRLRLPTKWVRASLIQNGCSAARLKRAPIPTAFFQTERGHDFRLAAERERAALDRQQMALSAPRFAAACGRR